MRLLLTGVVAVSFGVSLLLAPASAVATGSPGTDITTSPVSSVLHVVPGQSVSTTISVQNNALKPTNIQVQLETFKPYGTNGQARVLPPSPNSVFMSWVHFSQTSFVAQPGVWNQIRMTIKTPPTAALDYYYAVLIKPQVASTAQRRTTTTVKGYNAVLVLLDATSRNAKPMLSVGSFSTSHGLYEYLPATFSITAHNPGNVFLAPAGDIYISRSSDFGNVINAIPINPGQGNIIPGSNRVFTLQWANGFPKFVPKTIGGQPLADKHGQPIEQLSWNFAQANKLRFGRYYAKLVFVYNNGTRDVPITAIVSFWVIPWKLGGLIAAFIVLAMVGLYVSGHKLASRAFRRTKNLRKIR